MSTCRCESHSSISTPKLIAVTGGPGAGKTAVLEVVRRHFCQHVAVLPESASILFGGGFPRGTSNLARCAAQRAIFKTQQEVERHAIEDGKYMLILCDRGTLDGLAYWPGSADGFLREVGTTYEAELARYSMVIHLHTPTPKHGYDRENPLRIETAREAVEIDRRIARAWEGHPNRHTVEAADDFLEKLERTIQMVEAHVPECCRSR